MLKKFLIGCLSVFLLGCIAVLIYMYGPWWLKELPGYDYTYGTISSIDVPEGYERISDDETGFADYLRNLPLAAEDEQVHIFSGELVDSLLPYTYRVINMPLFNRYEQCADVCIRMRAEYLFRTRQFRKIHFEDTQYNTMRYYWGGRWSKFVPYLRYVFKFANTESLIHEMPQRPLSEMQVGDMFVYCNKDREDKDYGHAIMVADVARNPVTGKKIFMLLQGSTPACDIHILKNRENPALSPWFELDEKASVLNLGTASYFPGELRYFK